MANLYADENFPLSVVEELRHLGHDVLTVAESGKANQRVPDDEVLKIATDTHRIVLTFNRKDFIKLHQQNSNHAGIIACTFDSDFTALAQRIQPEKIPFFAYSPNAKIIINKLRKFVMLKKMFLLSLMVLGLVGSLAQAQTDEIHVFGDPRPDAPALAPRGEYQVGIRTLEWVNPDQLDVMSITAENPTPRYDRPITVEVWYPAVIPAGETALTEYTEFAGRADSPSTPGGTFTFPGRALREAEPEASTYPLIIMSHGFPGSALQLTYLGENLASKGYVVIGIHHTDSNFDDVAPTSNQSALMNRALDIQFVLNQAAVDEFTSAIADTNNVGLIGYSFGGYGVLNYLGAGLNGLTVNVGAPGKILAARQEGNEEFQANIVDERVKAAVLFAPYGGDLALAGFPGLSFWDQPAFEDITIPTFWAVGTLDDVSIYTGVTKIFGWAVNSDRYLLTYENARHNVAPNPPNPAAADLANFERYAEPAWDMQKLNNINEHFVTAFLGIHLQGQTDYQQYLDVPVVNSNEGVFDMGEDGTPGEDHTYWPGFPPRSAVGMRLEHVAAGE